jgi:hypothetical protein
VAGSFQACLAEHCRQVNLVAVVVEAPSAACEERRLDSAVDQKVEVVGWEAAVVVKANAWL